MFVTVSKQSGKKYFLNTNKHTPPLLLLLDSTFLRLIILLYSRVQ